MTTQFDDNLSQQLDLESASDEELGSIRDAVVKKLAERALLARSPTVRDGDVHHSVQHYQS